MTVGIRLCPTGKFAYVDEDDALKQLRRWGSMPESMHRNGRAPTKIYVCPHCGWFHMTSQKREAR